MKLFNNLDLNSNQVVNGVAHRLATAPSSPISGQFYYDNTLNQFGVYNGTAWIYLTVGTAGGFVARGGIDGSTNPNYPTGAVGDVYRVTVAGLIGGASGLPVQIGDMLFCFVAGAAGNQATVGANWSIEQANVDQATNSVLGLVALATQTETEAKVNASKVVSPSDLINFPVKKIFTIGDGTATSISCIHNLGTKDVVVQVRDATSDAVILVDMTNTSTTTSTIIFTTAPAVNSYKVTIIG